MSAWEFDVHEVFTVTGRGEFALGLIRDGTIQIGDAFTAHGRLGHVTAIESVYRGDRTPWVAVGTDIAVATGDVMRGRDWMESVGDIDFGAFDALTFDCYGTLIDWETGILSALRPVLERHGASRDDDTLLELFAHHEAALEAGPYRSYKAVLAGALKGIGTDLHFEPTQQEQDAFGVSVNDWPAFEDSAAALAQLKQRFKLGVITNCDDDLFAASNAKLGTTFDWVITAQQAEGYKPRIENFEYAFAHIDVPRERILHVAQSLFHDHVPAKALGMTTVWIDRRQGREGGATPPAAAVPDMTFPDLQSFADRATA
ncbi:haloacid dehalogenase type II [Solirubrobacter taibaiensis]|nr:haloacid dehalogenase type II [Solirubrobacter taibaiensis]